VPHTSDDATPRLQLPYLAAAQAQKHVTLNEALSVLDGLVQTAVESATLAAEPPSPPDGALYILPADRSGPEWSLHPVGALLRFADGGWTPLAANDGALAYVRDTGALLLRSGGAWRPLGQALGPLQNVSRLGLNTEAHADNPLAAKLNKALFTARPAEEGGDGDLRLTFNKDTAPDVLSLLFQSGYSGRAELGLVGDDDLQLKVSGDGAAWIEALRVERGTGRLWAGELAVDRSLAPNILPDSGRFVGAAANSAFTGGAFVAPAYLEPVGGSTVAAHARFLHDNTDYGGAAGLLDPDVKALLDLLRPPGGRRYGPDWWVAKVARGVQAVEPVVIDGETFDMTVNASLAPLPPRLTAGYYLKVVAGKAAVRHAGAQGSRIDDAAYGPGDPPTVLTAADGWRYVERRTYPNGFGYEYDLWGLRAVQGAELLLAMPRVSFGHVRFDRLTGLLPNDRIFA